MFRPGPPRDRLELPARFGFLDCEVDCEAIRVTRGGRELSLEPRAFDLLLLLAANPGRVIEKEEIFERLWPGVVVGDNALTRVVAHLRHALGDSAEEARVVETVRTRGYRFLPEVAARAPAARRDPDSAPAPGEAPAPEPAGAPAALRSPRRGRPWLAVVAALAGAVAIVLMVRQRADRERAAAPAWEPRPVQRTTEAGYRGEADLSSDGSQLVYASDAAGGLELFLRPVEGGREIQITFGGGPKREPAWSPDGRFIAYRDLAAGGIWLVSPTGGSPRQLTDFGSQPAWFPDGQRLVFAAPGRPTLGSLEWPATYASTLWTVALESGQVREITRPDPVAGGHGMPAVSADGRWVYFATGRHVGGGALWRVAAEGGVPERLTPEEPSEASAQNLDLWLDPTPTPDGRALLAIEVGVTWRIVRVALDGSGGVEPVLATAPDGVGSLGLSRDGRRLVYTAQVNRTRLEEIELGADGEASGPPRVLSAPATQRVLMPSYFPDGSRIFFQQRRSGVGSELLVLDRASGETRSIAVKREIGFAWTAPTRVALGPPELGTELDLATGRRLERPLPAGAAALQALAGTRQVARSSDGRSIAFTAAGAGGPQELFRGDLETGESAQLTRLPGTIDYPVFSRDGRWLAFEVFPAGSADNELWRLPSSGGEPERLPAGRGPSWLGSFAPDGATVVFAAQRRGTWYLATTGIARPERLLAVTPETVGYLRWPDWSPDGRHIVYERMHYEAGVWTLDLPPSP